MNEYKSSNEEMKIESNNQTFDSKKNSIPPKSAGVTRATGINMRNMGQFATTTNVQNDIKSESATERNNGKYSHIKNSAVKIDYMDQNTGEIIQLDNEDNYGSTKHLFEQGTTGDRFNTVNVDTEILNADNVGGGEIG